MHAEPGVSKYSTIVLLRTRNYLPGPLIFPVQIDITLHSKDQEKVHLEKCLQSVDLQITSRNGGSTSHAKYRNCFRWVCFRLTCHVDPSLLLVNGGGEWRSNKLRFRTVVVVVVIYFLWFYFNGKDIINDHHE